MILFSLLFQSEDGMNKKVVFVILILFLLGIACGTITSTNQNKNPTDASSVAVAVGVATATLQASSTTGEPSETTDTGELPPLSFNELYEIGVEGGLWTEEEGVIRFLKYFSGENLTEEIPNIKDVALKTSSSVIDRANELLEGDEINSETKAEINRLLRKLLPPQSVLDAISQPETQTGITSPGKSAMIHFPAALASSEEECVNLAYEGYDPDKIDGQFCMISRERILTNGSVIQIYFPVWTQDREEDTAEILVYINMLLNTMEETALTYQKIKGLIVNNFSFVYSTDNAVQIGTSKIDQNSNSCILNYQGISEISEPLRQHIAYNMFSCVQQWTLGNIPDRWKLGTAMYFSNIVFPMGELELATMPYFDQRSTYTPIDRMGDESYIFFQFLGNIYGPDTVVEIMKKTKNDNIVEFNPYTASGTQGDFTRFVIEYLSSGIADENTGEYYHSSSPPKVTDNITVDREGDYNLGTEFLVAKRYFVDYTKEKRFLQTEISSHGAKITGVEATQFQNIYKWSGLPPEIRSSCKKDVRYLYVPAFVFPGDYRFSEIKLQVDTVEQAVCDPCLLGTWKVFNSSFEEYMTSIFEEQVPGVSGFQFAISGDYYLQFDTEGKFQAQRKDLTVVAGIGQIDYPIQPTLNPNSPGPQPTENGSFDLSFTPMVTTIINSNGIGNYWADGKTMKISQFVDGLESAQISGGLTFTHGFFSSLQSGGDAFESAMSSNPESTNANVDQEESAPYFCQGDALEITMPYTGSILQLYRVDQILPDPIPFFSPYYKEP